MEITLRTVLYVAGAVAAGVIVYKVVTRPKALPPSEPPMVPEAATPAKPRPEAIPAVPSNEDERGMEEDSLGRFGYTSFFTMASERIIVSDLIAWKNAHNVRPPCTIKEGFDPGVLGFGPTYEYFVEAHDATVDVLRNRYPKSSWPPNPESPQWPGHVWLFKRVYNLAREHVCEFVPVF